MSSSEDEGPELETLDISNDLYYRAPSVDLKSHQHQEHAIDDTPQLAEPTSTSSTSLDYEEFYSLPKSGSKTIRHSAPAYDLWRPFFPTFLSHEKFLGFHRPKLRHFNTGPQAMPRSRRVPREFPVKSLTRHIYTSHKRLQFKIMKAISSGKSKDQITDKILLIKKAKDLSAKCGELFLFEYCEENPSVLSQVGMASNVKIYRQGLINERLPNPRTPNCSSTVTHPDSADAEKKSQSPQGAQLNCNDQDDSGLRIGIHEKVQKGTKPLYFFKELQPMTKLSVIENNLYRAPIFEHKLPSCDFLIIRTRNSIYIRQVDTIFTVGQTMPLVAVPQPTENNIHKFRCDLSNVYIHRLFRESQTKPLSLDMKKLTKLFPDYHATVLKTRMRKNGAVLSARHHDTFVVGESNYGHLALSDIRRMLSPEQYCLGMASLAARERLRDLNYTESMIIPTVDAELETEILAAPWNTSRAVLDAMLGRHYLDLKKHLIDPSGPQREGFSCVAWSRSPTEEQQVKAMKANSKSSSQEPFQYQDKNPMAQKIRSEKLERLNIFKGEAQLINSVQSKVLASDEIISSSEDEAEDEDGRENILDEEFERQLNDLNKLVVGSRTMGEVNYENEEEERRQLLAEMSVNGVPDRQTQNSVNPVEHNVATNQFNLADARNKILRIIRTYDSPDGPIHRTEIVREPKIIALYVKMKGGSLNSSQVTDKSVDETPANQSMNGRLNQSFASTKSDSGVQRHRARSRSTSLGPSELCRAEGLTLTISKRVFGCM